LGRRREKTYTPFPFAAQTTPAALEEINEALEDLESRKIARAVIEMER